MPNFAGCRRKRAPPGMVARRVLSRRSFLPGRGPREPVTGSLRRAEGLTALGGGQSAGPAGDDRDRWGLSGAAAMHCVAGRCAADDDRDRRTASGRHPRSWWWKCRSVPRILGLPSIAEPGEERADMSGGRPIPWGGGRPRRGRAAAGMPKLTGRRGTVPQPPSWPPGRGGRIPSACRSAVGRLRQKRPPRVKGWTGR